MNRTQTLTTLAACLLAGATIACGGSTAQTPVDAGAGDATTDGSSDDAGSADAASPDAEDGSGSDDAESDGSEPDGGDTGSGSGDTDPETDAANDAGDTDPGADADDAEDTADTDADAIADTGTDTDRELPGDEVGDAGACEYLDLDIWLLRCGGEWAYGRWFTDLGGDPACPPYAVVNGNRYDTIDDAYAAESCDPQCELRAATSVSAMCTDGRRTGWIEYRSPEPGCPPAFEFAEGIFESVEAWNAETGCLPGE